MSIKSPHDTSNNNLKVPWEPYKAATNTNLNKIPLNLNNHILTSSSFTNSKLIKYKIETNLDKFNMNRPGYQFDDLDLKSIKDNSKLAVELSKNTIESIKSCSNSQPLTASIQTNLANDLISNDNESQLPDDKTSKLPPNFIDARFYTDVHFLKLANQLKKKCVDSSNSTTSIGKPINVVGPMIERKKSNQQNNSEQLDEMTPYGADKNSLKYWKAQQKQYESDIEYLKGQIVGINEQLQIQTQVNVELKKLLVASIGGEDIQYKMERLINDKQRYEYELSNNSKLIEKLNEDIEQISIQCDLWRSKFLASKLMNEENSTWKSFLMLLSLQNENVIKNLTSDNELLNEKLNDALDLLHKYNNSIGVNNLSKFKSKNCNNFQAVNLILANLNNLCKSKNIKPINANNLILNNANETVKLISARTLTESIAIQHLEQFEWLKSAALQSDPNLSAFNSSESKMNNLNLIDSLDKLEKLIKRIKMTRANSYGRLFQSFGSSDNDLFLNVCIKCKGQVQIV